MSNCYCVITIALSVITDSVICFELANHSSGCLLQSQQFATPIQTERSDEGGQNRTENSLLLLNYELFVLDRIDQ